MLDIKAYLSRRSAALKELSARKLVDERDLTPAQLFSRFLDLWNFHRACSVVNFEIHGADSLEAEFRKNVMVRAASFQKIRESGL